MPVWEQQITESSNAGQWAVSDARWRVFVYDVRASIDYVAGLRFTDVTVPRNARIVSATLTAYEYSTGSGNPFQAAAFLTGDLPAFSTGTEHRDRAHTASTPEVYPSGGVFTADVTALVEEVVALPGWAEGNALGFRLTNGSYAGAILDKAEPITLSIEWQRGAQYLNVPAPLSVPVTVGAVQDVTRSVHAQPVHVPVTVGTLDVIAPRALTATGINLTVTVGTPGMSGTGQAPPLNVAGTLHLDVTVGVALLSATAPPTPPPIPWERLLVTDAYAEALATRHPVTDARVEVIAPDGAVIATLGGPEATHPGVVAGTVTCTGNAEIRWTCDLTVDNPDLVPLTSRDLLHPLSHNRLRVWWRIQLPDGTWGEIPVGTYYLDWPAVSDDGEADVGMTVRGSDAAAEIKRARYEASISVGGMTASTAIATILAERAPWAPTSISPTSYRLPDDYEAGEPGGDPWADIVTIAQAAGMVAYVDRVGVVTVTNLPDPAAPPRATFQEGPGCAMTELSSEIDLDAVANVVTVVAPQQGDTAPIAATARDNDPTSPLWVGHGHIYHQRIQVDEITTQAQADAMAAQLLNEYRAVTDQVEIVAFAHPHLDPGDVVEVGRARAGVSGSRQVQSWSLALGDLSGMRITTTGRRGLS